MDYSFTDKKNIFFIGVFVSSCVFTKEQVELQFMEKQYLDRYFQKKLSKQEEAEVENWLLDPLNREEVLQYITDVYQSGEGESHIADIPAFEELWQKLDHGPKGKLVFLKNRRTWATVAASVFFLCMGGWMGYQLNASAPHDGPWHVESRVVDGKKITEISMVDGSKFVLEPNSKLSYQKNSTNEATIYLDGAAYFDIEKGEKNYTIKTKDISASTRDGKINISAYPKDSTVKILVSEGSAELQHPKAVVPLAKIRPANKPDTSMMLLKIVSNEEAVFNRSTMTTKIQPVDPTESPLLLLYPLNTKDAGTELIEFANISLDDLLLELQNKFNLDFVKQPGLRLKTPTFSGRFNIKENPFHILILACEKMGITYEVENGIILIKNNN